MPVSQPTRHSAYGLRITTVSGDRFTLFPTFELLARALSLHLDGGVRYSRQRRDAVFFTRILNGGTLLRTQKHDRYKVEFNEWGPVNATEYGAWTTYETYDRSGRILQIAGVVIQGDAFERANPTKSFHGRTAFWIHSRSYCGYGPVPGVRKWRGGYKSMRRIHTTPEKRMNQLVAKEDGEVGARKARVGSNLPCSYDDICRNYQRSWKNQFKGKKSWDRGR